MIEAHTFVSPDEWKRLLVLGSVHGDEVCGTQAIEQTVSNILAGDMNIRSGSVTFIPRANLDAYRTGTRFVQYNLNRLFGPRPVDSREHQIAKSIEPYIREADFLLDLHSLHEWDDPFVFLESPVPQAREFVENVHIPHVVVGWETLYANTSDMDTVAYATSVGVPGVTVECWQHKDPNSVIHAVRAITTALQMCWNIPFTISTRPEKVFVRACEIVYRPEGANFTRQWKNFDVVRAGELIGTSLGGAVSHYAPYDGYILIPKPTGVAWEEWYYLGIKETSVQR